MPPHPPSPGTPSGPNADPESEQSKVDAAVDLALCNGLLMRRTDGQLSHVPFTLHPSPYPRAAFAQAWALADDFNRLFAAIAADHAFICAVSEPAAAADPFTAELLAAYQYARQHGAGQTLQLGLLRADYLLQQGDTESDPGSWLRQVEVNTIASAFGAMATRTSALHRQLDAGAKPDSLPANDCERGLSEAMAIACQHYSDADTGHSAHHGRQVAVLFIVQPGERNVFDQRHVEHRLQQTHDIRVLRRSLAEVDAEARIDADSGALWIGEHEIGLVYFRAGYTPDDYPQATQWSARRLIECSTAIKCPSLALQLCGSKKMQQQLAAAGILERFVSDPQRVAAMRASFAELQALDENSVELACRHPERYVLKPQREGGGNNYYDDALRNQLESMPSSAWNGWILMERIRPKPGDSCLVSDGRASAPSEVIGELGIFAAYLSDGAELLHNRAIGHLLRTKPAHADEGGVAAGVAVLDSPALY